MWKIPPHALFMWATVSMLLAVFTLDGLLELGRVWTGRPEFSFGMVIPFVVTFLIWQRKEQLARIEFAGSWVGVTILLFGVLVRLAGDLAASWLFVEYGFVIILLGLVYAYVGPKAMRLLWVPMLFLFFMLPLPEVALQDLLQQLQLASSMIGVSLIRACDISVYVEGNLIDLGAMKLQVAEACSGLRYLFSLLTLGFIAAYFFKVTLWKRLVVFASAVPITVLMNSLRIALVGITVEYFGRSAGEGVLHYFEGMVVFVAALGLLVAEMWVLARIGGAKVPFTAVFAMELPVRAVTGVPPITRSIPAPFYVCLLLLITALVVERQLPQRLQVKPVRESFAGFPLDLGGWKGRHDRLEKVYLDVLKVDDYVVIDYVNEGREVVNLHIQYYDTQGREAATHSPRVCIPAGGWEIQRLEQRALVDVPYRGSPLEVNRAVITRGDSTLLVYYWFQQRGRNSTNEMGTKVFILWDSLSKNRSDGSMVRLITARRLGESLDLADGRLTRFAHLLVPRLTPFIPE